MAQYPAVVKLSSLDGTKGFKLSGEAEKDFSGHSVASAGDINGDGFADLIVGAYGADPHGTFSGASYVVFGADAAFPSNIDLSSLNGNNGFKLSGVVATDFSGWSVASAGDVNGDGFSDLIIGAPFAEPNGYDSGASYVFFGSDAAFPSNINLSSLNSNNGFKLSGVASSDYSGFSVASAGDINGDGFADVIIGAWGAKTTGASYVVFGRTSGFSSNIDLSSLDGSNGFKIRGVARDYPAGYSVASAGDVNGDGFADMIIGASFGASYVVFGANAAFPSNIDLSSLDGSNGFKLSGDTSSDRAGFSVASAGDVNGDGLADVIIGEPFGGPIDLSGASYVVFGRVSGFSSNIDLSSLDGSNGFKISGVTEFGSAGISVASAGDVNGDGFADMVIGAYAGESYVVFGSAAGFASNIDLSSLDGNNGFRIEGIPGSAYSGRSVASAGDVNGDGFDDLIVGAPFADPHGVKSGASYVVFGSKPSEAVDRSGTNIAQTIRGSDFDDTLTGLGGNDTLVGYRGADSLFGGKDKDLLVGGLGADKLAGGGGIDTASYLEARGAVTADLRTPSINTGEAAGDTYSSVEDLIGSAFADVLHGSIGANRIDGGEGNDSLASRSGGDVLVGGSGNDTLDGGAGIDTLVGGNGNDIYKVDDSADTVTEGAGKGALDRVLARVDYALTAGSSVEVLRASGGTGLILTGNEFANSILGARGADTLDGRAGSDMLTGSSGADTFVFSTALNAVTNVDRIDDFSVAADTVGLDAAIFTALATTTGNTLADAEFYAGAAAHDVDDRIVYNAVNGKLFYDADGNGAGAAILFAKLSPGLALTHDDFAVV